MPKTISKIAVENGTTEKWVRQKLEAFEITLTGDSLPDEAVAILERSLQTDRDIITKAAKGRVPQKYYEAFSKLIRELREKK